MVHNAYWLTRQQLNEVGDSEWELVSHCIGTDRKGETEHQYIFKRPQLEIPKSPTDGQIDQLAKELADDCEKRENPMPHVYEGLTEL